MPVLLPLLALAVFAQGSSEFMLAGLLPAISADLGVPLAATGLLTSAYAAGMVVGAPVTAAFGRRWPPRATLSSLLVVFVLVHAIGAATDSLAVLLVSRVVAALANAGFLALSLTLVTRLSAPGREARALAVVLAGTTLALIVGVPAGAAIGAAWDWRAALWAVALVCSPALVAILVAAPPRAQGGQVPLRRELRALREPRLHRTLVLVAALNAATFCGYTFLVPVVTGPAALGAGAVPPLLGLFGVGALVGVTVGGRLADRHGRRLLLLGTPALAVTWVAAVLVAPAGWLVVPVVAVLGALSFALGSTGIALAVRHGSSAPSLGGSFPTAALNVGAVLGPAVGGVAVSSGLGASGPWLASAAVAAVAWVVLVASRDAIVPSGGTRGGPGGG